MDVQAKTNKRTYIRRQKGSDETPYIIIDSTYQGKVRMNAALRDMTNGWERVDYSINRKDLKAIIKKNNKSGLYKVVNAGYQRSFCGAGALAYDAGIPERTKLPVTLKNGDIVIDLEAVASKKGAKE